MTKCTEEVFVKILVKILHKTIIKIIRYEDESLTFVTSDNKKYKMYHPQDCFEEVSIEDIVGDLDDLIGSPILMAEKITHDKEIPEGLTNPRKDEDYDGGQSFTWTFYKFATIKGSVTIRWFGNSNGYYSEEVEFKEIDAKTD